MALVNINFWEMIREVFRWAWAFFWFAMKYFLWVFPILILAGILRPVHSVYINKKTYIDENGYRRFSNSEMLVHRWVVENKLDRKLDDREVVHHKNRNKLDNRPENLEVFANQDEHNKEHGYSSFNDESYNEF